MKLQMRDVAKVIDTLLRTKAHRATKYLAPNFVINATRRKYRRGGYTDDVILTFGRPNWRCRQFIRMCRRAGEPFPVKKIQLSGSI